MGRPADDSGGRSMAGRSVGGDEEDSSWRSNRRVPHRCRPSCIQPTSMDSSGPCGSRIHRKWSEDVMRCSRLVG